ncbi:hypothetical protein ACFWBF_33175 [Streptomyces sp. NPDC060028]|uniref:hypothetical protein n=1 Tax=Streptomyces sp. NPDC060028 TaxID=3347041 RepID=UPI0036B5A930
MGQKTTQGIESTGDAKETDGKKKLDLSVAQIAGSSLATVAAALLASQMGVYGTILGAGVVSVVATAGGPVIQHFFKRTGDQLRETARPRARQLPVAEPVPGPGEEGGALPSGEFGEATVHGTRVRGWKRTAVASGAAFAIALGGLGTYEAVAGTSISEGGGTILTGGLRTAPDHDPAPPAKESGTGGKDGEDKGGKGGKGGETPEPGTSPSPSGSHGGRSPSPGPSPSDSGGPKPSPSPTPPKPATTPTPGGSAPDNSVPGNSVPGTGQQGQRTPS